MVFGEATVSVSLRVEASSAKEAKKLAREAMSSEWECDEVDGEVTLLKEPATKVSDDE